ncbi:MAG: type II secretion system protein GspM [Spirochaetes bacterium]|jgi:type II secretory pathway component PulM|nr:type II secretion system protein GspM [Spirochaetota bacterium]
MLALKTISDREKKLLLLLALILTGVLLFKFVYTPLTTISEDSVQDDRSAEAQIAELNKLFNTYENARRENNRFENLLNRKSGEALASIDDLITKHNMVSQIAYKRSNPTNIQNKYTRYNMDLKFVSVPIQSLLAFIQDIESKNNLIYINYLDIKNVAKERNLYDILLKIYIYEKN